MDKTAMSRVGAVLSSALLLFVSACGVATQSQSSASTNCDNGISIGAPYPLTGVWAENGQNSLHGMQLAADQINATGGIKSLHGAKLKIVSADTSSDNPGQAKTVTEKMLQQGNVSALVGSYLSSMTLTTVVAAETQQVPLVTQSFVDDLTQKGYHYLFQIPPKASQFGIKTVQDAQGVFQQQGKPLRTVVVAGSDDASTKAESLGAVNGAHQQGLTVGDPIIFQNGLSDATSIVSKIADANADLIVLGGNVSDLSLIIKGLRSRGVQTPIASVGGGGALTPQFAQSLGPMANGIMATGAWNFDLKLPGVADVAAAYQKQFGVFMPQEAGESWAAVYQLSQIMDSHATCDPKAIRDALTTTEFDSGQAAAVPPGKVGFDSTGLNKFIEPIMEQWQNGTLRTVYPADVATTPALPLGAH
jgi:branched-chain amino acid transport system substrate-binding protein